MSSAGFSVYRWALDDAPTLLRADKRTDMEAHAVLTALAGFADKTGYCHPGLPAIARRARLTDRYTVAALERLVASGLVESAEEWRGVPGWRLRLDRVREDDGGEARRAATKRKAAERAKRYRARLADGSRHAVVERDASTEDEVTDGSRDAVLERDVTPQYGVTEPDRHAVVERDVTPDYDVTNAVLQRDVTPYSSSQPQVTPPVTANRTANELPLELPSGAEAPERDAATARPATVDTNAEFDAFWVVYPRREGKQAARSAYAKARAGNKRQHRAPVAADAILDGARRYAAHRAGQDPKYTKQPATWLNQGCWDDELAPRTPDTARRPSTTDQRVADIQALKAKYANDPRNNRPARDVPLLRAVPGGAS